MILLSKDLNVIISEVDKKENLKTSSLSQLILLIDSILAYFNISEETFIKLYQKKPKNLIDKNILKQNTFVISSENVIEIEDDF